MAIGRRKRHVRCGVEAPVAIRRDSRQERVSCDLAKGHPGEHEFVIGDRSYLSWGWV